MARNYAFYRHHTHTAGSATSKHPANQPRNVPTLRQNLFQVMGLLALSAKGPVYTLPKVDPQKVNEAELLTSTHPWLSPSAHPEQKGDDPMVVRVLSTVCSQLELNNTHKAMYWLSVLVEYEKHQKKHFKRTLTMMARKPVLPPPNSQNGLLQAVVSGRHACDWVWLLWEGLRVACARYRRSAACSKSFEALGYLFSTDYTSSKRGARMPILLHAMLLVRTDTADWGRSVYPNEQAAALISKACTRADVMYRDIANRRTQREKQLGLAAGGDSRRLQVAPAHNKTAPPFTSPPTGGNRHGAVDPSLNCCVAAPYGIRKRVGGGGGGQSSSHMIVMHMDPDDPRAVAHDTQSVVKSGAKQGASHVGAHCNSAVPGLASATLRKKKGGGPCMSEDSARKLQIMGAIDDAFLS
jgi:hypothetical protein